MVEMIDIDKFVSKIERSVDYVVYSRMSSYDLWQAQITFTSLKQAKSFCREKILYRQAKVVRRLTEVITIQQVSDSYKKPLDPYTKQTDQEVEQRVSNQ
jgi:hypothetical protein